MTSIVSHISSALQGASRCETGVSRDQIYFQIPMTGVVLISSFDDDNILTDEHKRYIINNYVINCVENSGRKFTLRSGLEIISQFDGEVWSIESEDLDILGYGYNEIEAKESFDIQFAATWDAIVQESDDALTIDAQLIKRKMQQVVAKVSR